ncbi:MAG: mevalonate kinase family protein [Candidatus Hodarchaeales archaeon]|jgi:galactokinase
MIRSICAPSRIVLFGEHQDYLGLPVIPAAIDLQIRINGQLTRNDEIIILLDDINQIESFKPSMNAPLPERGYLRSGVRVLQREGIIPNICGINAQITSEIPIQAGLSSSSALIVVWIKFLAEMFEHELSPMELTNLAFKAEVTEFNEPGGMQDHMAIAHGYVNYEEFDPIRCTRLLESMQGLVVGDSLETKDTLSTLANIKQGVFSALKEMGEKKITDIQASDVTPSSINDPLQRSYLIAAINNLELTKQAYEEIRSAKHNFNPEFIGGLITRHHQILRDYLHISTPKIEKMIEAAFKAGAIGAKITGSGQGGCMIAFCPDKEKLVSKAIEEAGGRSYIVNVASGAGNC